MGEEHAVRVVVADDHTYFRDGLVGLLRDCGVDVVEDVPNGEAAIVSVREHKPDVVVMDVSMPGLGGIESTRRITEEAPDCRVLMLSVSQEDEDILGAILAGACGFVLKDGPIEDVVAGIEAAAAGEAVFSGRIAQRLLRHVKERSEGVPHTEKLSTREVEVLSLLADTADVGVVAERLSLPVDRVRRAITDILLKLQARSRADVVVRAMRDRIV
jgi:DNA-binding NarL/FixJ family response regulator